MGPLKGIKVVDMTTVLMGPYATQMLGDYGADVIKVESLDGDVTRLIGPMRHAGMGPVFLNTNRSKRSICLDLKKPAGREAVLRLLKDADVLVYNVRPQAMARLQLGYDVVSEINPRLVYAGVFGFGQDGPYAAKPAYDDLIQGATALPALMAQTGDGVPRYVPNALVDRIVGLTAVGAICASLVHRDRTGRGQRVDIPMFETMAGFVMGDHMGGLTYEPPLDKGGYARHLSRDRRPYKTSDGYLSVIVYNDKQWENFFKATGRDDLRADPKFANFAGRAANIDVVYAELARIFETRTTAEWIDLLTKADVPVMPMHDLASILHDEHLEATELLPGREPSDRGPDPQHEGDGDLVGDGSRACQARATAQRERRGDPARDRLLRRRDRGHGPRWRHALAAGPEVGGTMSFITGVGLTPYGKHEGSSSLDLMSKAAPARARRCRAEARRYRRHALRLLHRLAAHHAGDRLRRAFWYPPELRPCRAGRRRDRACDDDARASPRRYRASRATCSWSPARTVSPGRAATPRSRRWRRSAIPSTRCRWGRPFPPITASSPPAICTNTA